MAKKTGKGGNGKSSRQPRAPRAKGARAPRTRTPRASKPAGDGKAVKEKLAVVVTVARRIFTPRFHKNVEVTIPQGRGHPSLDIEVRAKHASKREGKSRAGGKALAGGEAEKHHVFSDHKLLQRLTKKGLSQKQAKQELSMGAKVETEHTSNPKVAKHIARDHLVERPDYYAKLAKMEKSPVIIPENNQDLLELAKKSGKNKEKKPGKERIKELHDAEKEQKHHVREREKRHEKVSIKKRADGDYIVDFQGKNTSEAMVVPGRKTAQKIARLFKRDGAKASPEVDKIRDAAFAARSHTMAIATDNKRVKATIGRLEKLEDILDRDDERAWNIRDTIQRAVVHGDKNVLKRELGMAARLEQRFRREKHERSKKPSSERIAEWIRETSALGSRIAERHSQHARVARTEAVLQRPAVRSRYTSHRR
jgi:hypothetical protein